MKKFGSYRFFFCSGEKDVWFPHRIFIFLKVSPFEGELVLRLNKVKYPYPKDALCQFYVILHNGPWEESFKNTKPYFHSFLVLSFWMGTGPSFEQT